MKRAIGLFLFLVCAVTSSYAAPATGSNCTPLTKVSSAAPTTSASLASTPSVGSYVEVMTGSYISGSATAAGHTAADNQGNTYANDVHKRADTNLTDKLDFLRSKVATASGTFTITVTADGGQSASWAWIACEMTGIASSSPLDQTGSTEVNGTSLTVTAGGANAQASEIVFTGIFDGNGANAASGYTVLASDTTLLGVWFGYKIVTGIETSAASWTFASADAIGVIATYKATSGGCTPDHWAFTAQPGNATVGQNVGTIAFAVKDSGGITCTSATTAWTLAKKGGTCAGMTLNGTVSGSAASGVASTSNVNLTAATGACTLTLSGTITSADSSAFTISAVPSTTNRRSALGIQRTGSRSVK